MNNIKNVLIAEDHAVVRIGTKMLLKRFRPNVDVVGVDNFTDVINNLKERVFELIILDINMPGGNNLKMIETIRTYQPSIYILVFSSYDEQMYALPYLQAGADGYLSKEAPEEEFEAALEKVENQKKYLSTTLQENTISNFLSTGKKSVDPITTLSKREMDVANLLVKGYGTAEIGNMLNLQLSTVSTFKSRIFNKLDVKNVVELITKMSMIQHLEG